MSDAQVPPAASAPPARPRSVGWDLAAGAIIGVVCAGAGWLSGPLLIFSAFGGLPTMLTVGAIFLVLLGAVVSGLDALVTLKRGAVARAALVVLAVVLTLAAAITIDFRATGGYPTGWGLLAPLAGTAGFGASLVLSRRTLPTVVGALALAGLGVAFLAIVQHATADNVYPPYVGLGL